MGAGSASAKDRTSNLGVGVDRTLGGASGVHAHYRVSPLFGLHTVLAFDHYSPDGGDSRSSLELGLGVIYTMVQVQALALAFTGHFNLATVPQGGESGVQLAFDAGIRPEYFINNFLSIHMTLGLVFSIIPDEGSGLSAPQGTLADSAETNAPKGTFFAAAPSGTFGTFGFTFWFN